MIKGTKISRTSCINARNNGYKSDLNSDKMSFETSTYKDENNLCGRGLQLYQQSN